MQSAAPPPHFANPAQFIAYVSKNPFTEVINGVKYTYSYLKKKGQTLSSLTNDRLLILKGINSIGYAREMPQVVEFHSEMAMPKPKAAHSLSELLAIESTRMTSSSPSPKKKCGSFNARHIAALKTGNGTLHLPSRNTSSSLRANTKNTQITWPAKCYRWPVLGSPTPSQPSPHSHRQHKINHLRSNQRFF